MTTHTSCELCTQPAGEVLFRDEKLRVVLVDDANYPGFCRVIWNAHVKEMTDLSPDDRSFFMNIVWQIEAAVREVMQPDKINIACLGNMVPHLHWHVIPRYIDDAHFPNPIWSEMKRTPTSYDLTERKALLPALRKSVQEHLARFF
jgi:diadenosine tetraphosphate (Ap4A) HIT family hydrolase